ncbi:Uncharacterized protein TCAP_04924 [Tolypocladium capitatum]|uniref:Phosphoribulokinase/uridine kinase domain-containing protein n=1 Tax=Tolypocladium capitatum TaxID=45235 RepID=A0A2K3QCA5_9HYPO|nr:Uncharacterized protein TCAP_04924 [Tolypocladium capitatum]
MDDQVRRLVEKAWAKYQAAPPDQRLLIGIAGIPGSGKTTLSQAVSQGLNARAAQTNPLDPPPATFVPMDGFHLTRAALSAMPDPARAHARRGAAFTFDAPKFLALVQALRAAPRTQPILAPSFDHAVKDPREGDIALLPTHRVVILEGNYLALDRDVWRDAAALLDELWFVDVDFDVARRRLRERHVRAGIARDLQEGDRRATENDLVNGEEIVTHRLRVDEVVQSREDGSWAHE